MRQPSRRRITDCLTRYTLRVLAAATLGGSALSAGATALLAQGEPPVGYVPAESPYNDLVYRSAFTAFTGWFVAASDPAGVAPQSGPMFGLRWDARIGGPVTFMSRLSTVATERTVIDPARPLAERDRGTVGIPLTILDVGVGLNLTGQRSWRSLVPTVNLGVGLVSDIQTEDVGGFSLGTNLALSLGAGVQYVPQGGRWSVRADLTDHLYRVRYPGLYYGDPSIPAGVPPVLDANVRRSRWTNNYALTLGAAYQLWR